MKNAFYFMLKTFFVLEIFTFFCPDFLVIYDIEKRLDKKTKVNFKIYDVTEWLTANYNIHITQYLKK